MEHAECDSRAALKRFLRERRKQIRPLRTSLVNGGARRRQPGLSRDEVAELLGVSAHWYSLFESATSGRQFSHAFLARVMDVLALDRADRETLQTLAVACGVVRSQTTLPLDAARLRHILEGVARVARSLAHESDSNRASTLAIAGLRDIVAVNDIDVEVFIGAGDTLQRVFEDEPDGMPPNRTFRRGGSIAVPIVAEGEVHGVIRIDARRVNAFTAVDSAIAATIGKQLALTLLPA